MLFRGENGFDTIAECENATVGLSYVVHVDMKGCICHFVAGTPFYLQGD